jgi:hypothetical protein
MTQSYIQKPKLASAYYDKSGLIPNNMIDDIYAEVSGVMTEVYGYSPQKAREITDAGIYKIEHPPIKINWSKNLFLSKQEITLATQQIHKNELGIAEDKLDVTTKQVTQTQAAEQATMNKWLETYQVPVMKDNKPVLLENGQPKMQVLSRDMVSLTPGVDRDFRNSGAYMQHVKDSSSAKIMLMQQDPTNFKESSMAYLNTAFPGMYGGTVKSSDMDGAQYGDYVSKINPMQVFYVEQEATDIEGAPDGFVATGAEIMFVWKNQYGSAETMNAGNNYVATTVSAVQKDDVEGNAAVDAAEAQIVRAKELLALAKETGEGKGAIDSLTRQVAIAEDNVIEVKQDAADDAARSAFKTRQADRRDAPNVYKGDQYSWQGNRDDLEIAIEERDIDKVKALVANLTTLLDTTNPSNDTMKKLGSVRGDALRAVNNMPQLIEQDKLDVAGKVRQDKLDVAGKVRFDSMESLRSRVSDAASGNVANDKLVALIKELNAAISKEEDGEGGRNSELNVRTLTDMKSTLIRRMI